MKTQNIHFDVFLASSRAVDFVKQVDNKVFENKTIIPRNCRALINLILYKENIIFPLCIIIYSAIYEHILSLQVSADLSICKAAVQRQDALQLLERFA